MKVSAAASILLCVRRAVDDVIQLRPFPYADVLFRVGHIFLDTGEQALQRMRAFSAEESAAVAVSVDVDRRMLLEFVGVRLRPFRRAEQHGLFAIPRGVDDGAL